jgi:hypothetical protein
MRRVGRADHDGVYPRRFDHLPHVCVGANSISVGKGPGALAIPAADSHEAGLRQASQGTGVQAGYLPVADESGIESIGHGVFILFSG